MKMAIALSLVVSISVSLAATAPASARGKGALSREGFLCLIDLNDAVGQPPPDVGLDGVVSTGETRKLCTPSGRVSIWCRTRIDGWSGRNVNVRDIPCNIFPCGSADLLEATSSHLHINRRGDALLICSLEGRR